MVIGAPAKIAKEFTDTGCIKELEFSYFQRSGNTMNWFYSPRVEELTITREGFPTRIRIIKFVHLLRWIQTPVAWLVAFSLTDDGSSFVVFFLLFFRGE